MSRRYSLPQHDGEVAVLALQMAVTQMETIEKDTGITAYERYLVLRMKTLLEKLEKYNWEAKK